MLRFTVAPYLLFAALAVAAPAPRPKPKTPDAEGDLKKMQGAWSVTRRMLGGREIPGTVNSVEIVGDRIRFLVGGEVRTEWVITLTSTQSPKVLDRKRVAVKGAAAKGGVGRVEILARGIYRLEGDSLSLSSVSGSGDQTRPADFEGKGRSETVYILKRVKP